MNTKNSGMSQELGATSWRTEAKVSFFRHMTSVSHWIVSTSMMSWRKNKQIVYWKFCHLLLFSGPRNAYMPESLWCALAALWAFCPECRHASLFCGQLCRKIKREENDKKCGEQLCSGDKGMISGGEKSARSRPEGGVFSTDGGRREKRKWDTLFSNLSLSQSNNTRFIEVRDRNSWKLWAHHFWLE